MQSLLMASAVAQARAIASGRISAAALLRLQREAIDQLDPGVNAYLARTPVVPVVDVDPPDAGSVAGPALGPLAGTGFAAKDNIDVAGLATTAGLRSMARIPGRDAAVVRRLKVAGLHCLGKLNMHPMALGGTNRNADFGDCAHPHRPGLTPGGSSGGSAAAVAAGLCAIALGTDTMGSVRIPAAYCGVVGLKPSHETLGLDGVVPLSRLLDHLGFLARRVEDIEAVLRIAAPALPEPSIATRRWRLAVLDGLPALGASDEVVAAFDCGVRRIAEEKDVDCVTVRLDDLDLSASRRAGLLLCEAELHPMLAPLLGREPAVLPADLLAMMRYIEGRTAVHLGRALAQVAAAGERLDSLSAGFDAVLLPTAPQVAFRMDQPAPANQADFTAMANMNGAPAISLPLPVSDKHLPVGLQAIGRRGHDLALLQLAARLEAILDRIR